jgi:8-oxo-dGTP pyrophosphatase MutT (NUDIX family)
MEDIFNLGIKALIRNKKGEILLLKVNPKKLINRSDWKGVAYWDIPGGRIKRGSSVNKTLLNEIKEEIGISNVKNIKSFAMVLSKIRIPLKNQRTSFGLILSAYTCEIPSNAKIKLSEEHVEAKWFTPKEASKLLAVKYPKEFTRKIKDI